jgi:hypothetical protein
MKVVGKLNKEPITLAVSVVTEEPTRLYLRVYDKDYQKTLYTDRFATVDGEQTFYIRMPITPQEAVLEISKSSKFEPIVSDEGFRITEIKRLPLKRKLGAFNYASSVVKGYIRFCEKFCSRASYISANGSIYTSNDGQFQIDYLDDIIGDNGRPLNTPARINRNTGIIQVSKKKFLEYTVPMRMAILLHEFAHYYLNENISNETEADLNALLIYLGLGYPRIDAYNVFTTVFAISNSDANKERMKVIDNFIRNFEKTYIDMTYDQDSLYRKYN